MIVYTCALHCEAKPIIDHFRLQKQQTRAFDLYQKDNYACVVSGIGDINMAAASAWAGANYESETIAWINLGIAGHRKLALGTAVVALKVDRQDNPRPLYPVPLFESSLEPTEIISTRTETLNYHETAAYDMEAHAFVQTCSRFSPLELIQSIKVISDNSQHPPKRDKAWISQLIAGSMQTITDYSLALEALARDYSLQHISPSQLARFTSLAHFTQTQRNQLKKILLGLRASDVSLDDSYHLVSALDDARRIIESLNNRLKQQSEVF